MNIYVDFDDCLCESARYYVRLAAEMFHSRVTYEEFRFFDMAKTFSLNEEQFDRFMIRGHAPEVLLSLEETPGASSVINEWLADSHQVSVITGRPLVAWEASRAWLDAHGLQKVPLFCFDKYGRDNLIKNSDFSLSLEDYRKMKFDFAVEDSPKAFPFFSHLPSLRVCVFDRPWNRDCVFPNENYARCFSWPEIRSRFSALLRDAGAC